MINVLHVAIEYGSAVLGGLGVIATEMVDAQNKMQRAGREIFAASIITPFYPHLYRSYADKKLVAEIEHLYNHEMIKSKVYLLQQGKNKHYIIEPPPKYQYLFNTVASVQQIYGDYEQNPFIERLKLFNSAVAAYVGNGPIGIHHPDPQILQLHDWQAALVPALLKNVYDNDRIKSAFVVHIDNSDSGKYTQESLNGIGLELKRPIQLLKAIGMQAADKIVTVSVNLLRESLTHVTDDPDLELLRKIFVMAKVQNKAAGIPNGFKYDKYCPLNKYVHDVDNIYAEKQRNKQELARRLRGSRGEWNFDPNLPLFLYVGRYSSGKGTGAFEQLIKATRGRASFVAFGRGMNDDVFNIVTNYSKQIDNVFVSFSKEEQDELLALARASADFIFAPSHAEAFALVLIEALANGALCFTTGVGGMRDIIQELNYSDKNNITGNTVVFDDGADGEINPSLIFHANRLIDLWNDLTDDQKNRLQTRVLHEAAKFDWQAPGGTLDQYLAVFNEILPSATTYPKPSMIK
jgi:glycogen synthase